MQYKPLIDYSKPAQQSRKRYFPWLVALVVLLVLGILWV